MKNESVSSKVFLQDRNKLVFISKIDPIVTDVMKDGHVDAITLNTFHTDTFPPHKLMLSTSLLIACHPKIKDMIEGVRQDMGLRKLLKYPHKNMKELLLLANQLYITQSISPLKLNQILNDFFHTVGIKLSRVIWEDSIISFILTGILPVPLWVQPFEFFRSHYLKTMPESKTMKKDESSTMDELLILGAEAKKFFNGCPVIAIRQRVDSIDELVRFIKIASEEIKDATKNLPKPPIKRIDINITKLAIGLWIIKNESEGSKWITDQIDEMYEQNEKYFGKYDSITKNDLSSFRSDALVYLNQLYPL